MIRSAPTDAVHAVAEAAIPIADAAAGLDPLLDRIADTSFVLLGEATHGTHEFYRTRAAITKRLIEERGFSAVAVEADWPDAYRLNRYVRGESDDASAAEALGDFQRFPLWMWRNEEVVDFIEWLRGFNRGRSAERQVGFYGLDLYSLYRSIDAVLEYLDRVDPEAAGRARERYACFDHFGDDARRYGHGVYVGARESCREEAVAQLVDLREQAAEYLRRDGLLAMDEQFFAERNAALIQNAEAYYREMFTGRVNTWNLRDRHMAETLAALEQHLSRRGEPARIAVWAHNSHLGDARATEMSRRGELNLGQLVRQRYRDRAVLVGLTTYEGAVSAASDWGGPVEHKAVRPALPGSYEALFHNADLDRFLILTDDERARRPLRGMRLERAIGVIYRPRTERISHYFDARLAEQFDAVLHFDVTTALRPLEITVQWRGAEAPETYPTGL